MSAPPAVSENAYLHGPPLKKRRIPFANEMLLPMPDPRKYATGTSDQETKVESFLQQLQPMHKEQRRRLLQRHMREFRQFVEDSGQQIDEGKKKNGVGEQASPGMYGVHFSPGTLLAEGKEAMMLEWSKELVASEGAREALGRLPMEKRTVFVAREQVVEMGKGMAPPEESGSGEWNAVEFARFFGDMGVVMRRRMCEEEVELRLLQAKEREMPMIFLTRMNREKYGGKGGGGGGGGAGGDGREGTAGGVVVRKPALKSATMPAPMAGVGPGGGSSSMTFATPSMDPRRSLTGGAVGSSTAGGHGQQPARRAHEAGQRPLNITIPPRGLPATDPRSNKGQSGGAGSTATTPSSPVATPRTATAPMTTPGTAGLTPRPNFSSYFSAPAHSSDLSPVHPLPPHLNTATATATITSTTLTTSPTMSAPPPPPPPPQFTNNPSSTPLTSPTDTVTLPLKPTNPPPPITSTTSTTTPLTNNVVNDSSSSQPPSFKPSCVNSLKDISSPHEVNSSTKIGSDISNPTIATAITIATGVTGTGTIGAAGIATTTTGTATTTTSPTTNDQISSINARNTILDSPLFFTASPQTHTESYSNSSRNSPGIEGRGLGSGGGRNGSASRGDGVGEE